MEAREATCAAVQQQTGATFVPPFNSVLTIAGQGTIGLELLQQARAGHAVRALWGRRQAHCYTPCTRKHSSRR